MARVRLNGKLVRSLGPPREQSQHCPRNGKCKSLHKSDTSLKTLIYDVAEGNIGGNSVFYAARRLQTYGSTSPPSSLAVAFLD